MALFNNYVRLPDGTEVMQEQEGVGMRYTIAGKRYSLYYTHTRQEVTVCDPVTGYKITSIPSAIKRVAGFSYRDIAAQALKDLIATHGEAKVAKAIDAKRAAMAAKEAS